MCPFSQYFSFVFVILSDKKQLRLFCLDLENYSRYCTFWHKQILWKFIDHKVLHVSFFHATFHSRDLVQHTKNEPLKRTWAVLLPKACGLFFGTFWQRYRGPSWTHQWRNWRKRIKCFQKVENQASFTGLLLAKFVPSDISELVSVRWNWANSKLYLNVSTL